MKFNSEFTPEKLSNPSIGSRIVETGPVLGWFSGVCISWDPTPQKPHLQWQWQILFFLSLGFPNSPKTCKKMSSWWWRACVFREGDFVPTWTFTPPHGCFPGRIPFDNKWNPREWPHFPAGKKKCQEKRDDSSLDESFLKPQISQILGLLIRCLEKVQKYSPNGGLMVIYHGTKQKKSP